MALSGRFWGLHLALLAGLDCLRLLVDAARERPTRCRLTFPKEVEHVWSCLQDPAQEVAGKAWKALDLALVSGDPTVRSDMSFGVDRRLHATAFPQAIAHLAAPADGGESSR